MRYVIENDKYKSDRYESVMELATTGNPLSLKESLGKYIPFKIMKSKGDGFSATFDVKKDDEPIRSYKVTIGVNEKVAVSTDFGKVRAKFRTIIFKEEEAGFGVANLEGGTGLYVLNTVARVILEYIRKNNPEGFKFTAAATGAAGTGRRKAYKALIMMLSREADYVDLTKSTEMSTGSFYLMRKDLFERWQDALRLTSTEQ